MVELPLPSLTTLPETPEPAGTLAADGVPAFLNLIVLPSTLSIEPSVISVPKLAPLVVRLALTVALPEPVAVVSPSALRASALPVTERSPPVELRSVIAPPVMLEGVWLVLVVIVAAPALMTAFFTPLARSMALRRSPTVAVGGDVAADAVAGRSGGGGRYCRRLERDGVAVDRER